MLKQISDLGFWFTNPFTLHSVASKIHLINSGIALFHIWIVWTIWGLRIKP